MTEVSTTAPPNDASTQPAERRALEGVTGADVGLFVLRVGLGVIVLGHGLQKLGWFEGGGYPTSISAQKAFLTQFGYSSVGFLAWVLTLTEIAAGLSLLFGFLTPLGAAGVIGIMWQFVAGLQWDGGLYGNSTAGGFEYSLVFLVAAIALGFTGPGRLSVDRALGWKLAGVRWGLVALALGLVVGTLVLTIWGSGFGGAPALPSG